jgi:hypothetical protein
MMKYTCSVAMGPIDQLAEIAKTAEEVGFDAIALPDSLFYMEKQSTDYPYTPDGSRMWDADTPWVDPLIAAAAMGAVTSTLFFYTNVMKLGSRNPLRRGNRLGARRIRVVRSSVRQARRPGRRDDRGHQTRPRRWHGGLPRQVLRFRQAADEPGTE